MARQAYEGLVEAFGAAKLRIASIFTDQAFETLELDF
jgi:hypothetical protein